MIENLSLSVFFFYFIFLVRVWVGVVANIQSRTDLNLESGRVLESEIEATLPFELSLLEKLLTVLLFATPAAQIHPLSGGRLPGEKHGVCLVSYRP